MIGFEMRRETGGTREGWRRWLFYWSGFGLLRLHDRYVLITVWCNNRSRGFLWFNSGAFLGFDNGRQ
jgi:hypothetical protein